MISQIQLVKKELILALLIQYSTVIYNNQSMFKRCSTFLYSISWINELLCNPVYASNKRQHKAPKDAKYSVSLAIPHLKFCLTCRADMSSTVTHAECMEPLFDTTVMRNFRVRPDQALDLDLSRQFIYSCVRRTHIPIRPTDQNHTRELTMITNKICHQRHDVVDVYGSNNKLAWSIITNTSSGIKNATCSSSPGHTSI